MKKILFSIGIITLIISLTSSGAEKKLPKLLDLGAKKCIPCKKMAPILEEMEKEFKGVLDVEFIDVWQPENKEKAKQHKIETIPTQIFFDADGKELWRHIGFISKKDMLDKWKELGYTFKATSASSTIERWKPMKQDTRSKNQICYMCDGDIDPKTKVTVHTAKGDINICSPHHLFIMLSCLQKDIENTEKSAKVTDWATGKMIPALEAIYLYGLDEKNGRPVIRAFADQKTAKKEMSNTGGSLIAYAVLKNKEFEPRCGFCDRAVYPQDAALIKVEPGLQTWGCCAHCSLGVASRMNTDIEVHQPDGLTGEIIVIKTRNGSIESITPKSAVAWFGMRKKGDGKFGSAGCFHQGDFVNQDNLKKWIEKHPLETGKEITINKALANKMKLKKEQIQKACKIGECSPK
jgi:thiol-disulfide isomerase/thioredoxin